MSTDPTQQAPQRRDPEDPVSGGYDDTADTGESDRDRGELARDPLAKADTTHEASRSIEPSG